MGTLTWNPQDSNATSATVVVSPGNLQWTLTSPSGTAQNGLRGLDGGYTGGDPHSLFYSATYTIVDNNAFTGIGIASLSPRPLDPATLLVAVICPNGFAFFNGGNNGGVGAFTYAIGDVIDTAVDMALLKIWFRKNGGAWAPSGDPALGTGGYSIANLSGKKLAPYSDLGGNGAPAGKWTANFGATAYSFAAPSGFLNWTSGNRAMFFNTQF
jgi:hypothetical protein